MANKDAMLEALEEIENGMCRIAALRSGVAFGRIALYMRSVKRCGYC